MYDGIMLMYVVHNVLLLILSMGQLQERPSRITFNVKNTLFACVLRMVIVHIHISLYHREVF